MPRSTRQPDAAAAEAAAAAAAPTEVQVLANLADIHARFFNKLQSASRAAKGEKSIPDLIRESKEFELAALKERGTLLERARDAATKRFDDDRAALQQQTERLKAEIETLKKVKPPKLETPAGPAPVPPLPGTKQAGEPTRSGRDVKGGGKPDR